MSGKSRGRGKSQHIPRQKAAEATSTHAPNGKFAVLRDIALEKTWKIYKIITEASKFK
jgi:hypothetical protein